MDPIHQNSHSIDFSKQFPVDLFPINRFKRQTIKHELCITALILFILVGDFYSTYLLLTNNC